MLVAKAQKLLSSLAMLNNMATNTKLESVNYLATQTKQCDKQGYSNRISHARELLLCYTSKKVTSKLHKPTNYKSNYTSTMYVKVNTSLCNGDANQWEDKVDTMILSQGSLGCHQATSSLCRPLTWWFGG